MELACYIAKKVGSPEEAITCGLSHAHNLARLYVPAHMTQTVHMDYTLHENIVTLNSIHKKACTT